MLHEISRPQHEQASAIACIEKYPACTNLDAARTRAAKMFATVQSPGITTAHAVGQNAAGMFWSKAYNNALCMRFGLRPSSPLYLDLGTRWPALDVHSRQLRAFRPSSQPSLRPTLSATAACRSQVLQSTRRIRLQSDASSEHSSNKPTLRRLLALLWPDRVLLGVALCFLIGAAVSQARY